MTLKEFVRNEIEGWKKLEVAWLLIACAVIVGLSIYWDDTVMGIISSTTGVICVVCTGKGKLSAYIFGLVNTVLYAIISYKAERRCSMRYIMCLCSLLDSMYGQDI